MFRIAVYLFVCLFGWLVGWLVGCIFACVIFIKSTVLIFNNNLSLFVTAVSCGDPGSPSNGKRDGWLFQYNNTVSFKCSPGYVLEGPKTRTCLANQTWSEAQPICKRKMTI